MRPPYGYPPRIADPTRRIAGAGRCHRSSSALGLSVHPASLSPRLARERRRSRQMRGECRRTLGDQGQHHSQTPEGPVVHAMQRMCPECPRAFPPVGFRLAPTLARQLPASQPVQPHPILLARVYARTKRGVRRFRGPRNFHIPPSGQPLESPHTAAVPAARVPWSVARRGCAVAGVIDR